MLRTGTPRRRSEAVLAHVAAGGGHASGFGRVGLLPVYWRKHGSRGFQGCGAFCGRDERDPLWFWPLRAYSQFGGLFAARQVRERTHVSAWLQSASPHLLRLHGRSEPRPGVQESRSKPGRCGIRSGYFSQERNPVKTFPMRNAVGVFLAMPESIHQAAREGNLPMCDKAALPGGRKCSSDFVRRAPRDAGEGVRRLPEGSRGDCPQGEQLVSGGRRWRPVFRLGGRREARPGSEKPVKAEPKWYGRLPSLGVRW